MLRPSKISQNQSLNDLVTEIVKNRLLMAAGAVPVDEELELGDRGEQDHPQDLGELVQGVSAVQEVLDAVFDQVGDCDSHGDCGREENVLVGKVV